MPERVLAAVVLAPLAVLVRRKTASRGGLAFGAAAGTADMGANVLFLLAVHRELLSLVGVIVAMYPASTVLLARWVLGERLRRIQLAGIALAAASLALIASG